jgi:hypothetical protein
MSKYLLIESRDSFEYADAGYFTGLAGDLAGRRNDVKLFLVQNAVLMARQGAQSPLAALVKGGRVQVLADDYSLRERAVATDTLLPAVQVSSVDTLVDLLAEDGVKAVWH